MFIRMRVIQLKALITGSFDPVTLGHYQLIKTAENIFDNVVVAILNNCDKTPLFSLDQRMKILNECLGNNKKITLIQYDGLISDLFVNNQIDVIVRGLRNVNDYIYENDLAAIYNQIDSRIHTLFLPSDSKYAHISSSYVRESLKYNLDLTNVLPENIIETVKKLYLENISRGV